MSLSGINGIANYQSMLRAVTFENSSSDNPTASSASRSITFSATDSNTKGGQLNQPQRCHLNQHRCGE